MAFNTLRELFGLPVWEGIPLEGLCDRAYLIWDRWTSYAERLRGIQIHSFADWSDFVRLTHKVEDYKRAYEIAAKARKKGIEREIAKMKRLGQTEKVFRGRSIICTIVCRDGEFFSSSRLVQKN